MNNKKAVKRKYPILFCILFCVSLLSGCSNVYHALSDGTDKILGGLSDATDKALHSAANTVVDEPKEAILNALSDFNKVSGESVLTKDKSLQGTRTVGSDSYVGEYNAKYDKYSGTEVVFGGTTIEREDGNTLSISCSLKIEDGKAIIFWKSGSDEPIAILEVTDDYSGSIEVGNGSNYIGVWCDDFIGTVEMNIE